MARKQTQNALAAQRRAGKTLGIRGDRVRAARALRDMTQFELARRSNIHVSAVSLVESGRKDLNALSVVALAKALEVSSDYLLGLTAEFGRR